MNDIPATSASDIHRPASSSNTALGTLIGVHALPGIVAIAAFTFDQCWMVNENHAPAHITAATLHWVQIAESPRTQMCRSSAESPRTVVIARLICRAEPWPDMVAPRRSDASVITGRDLVVEAVVIIALSPRTLVYPNPAPCFLWPWTSLIVSSMSANTRSFADRPAQVSHGPAPRGASGSPCRTAQCNRRSSPTAETNLWSMAP